MYAIIQSGSTQFRVQIGDEIDVDSRELRELEAGTLVEFKEVLYLNGEAVEVGAPALNNVLVKGEVLGESKGPKVTFVKYRPSHNERRKHGHRQKYARVKITEIQKVK